MKKGFVAPVSSLLLLIAASCGVDTEISPGPARLATLELETSFPEAFSYLSAVRELSHGKLLAADPMSEVLLRLDLESGMVDTLGSQGEGPQEWGQQDRVFPLPADSTLVVDLGNDRLTVVDPEGASVAWIPMYRVTEGARLRYIRPRFVDSAGFLYLPGPYDSEGGSPDSSSVVRFDRDGDTETVVAWVWHPERDRSRSARRPMMIPMDDWAVGADGRVAVVRANGFSVDWYLADGRIVGGPDHDDERFPVGDLEKEAEMETMSSGAIFTLVMGGVEGEESRQTRRGVPPGAAPEMDDFEWPEELPLLRVEGTLVSPRMEAWVQRMVPAGNVPRVEVFDSTGIRTGFVDLPLGSKLIGFGSGPEGEEAAYLVRTDEVGLLWLGRYRILR